MIESARQHLSLDDQILKLKSRGLQVSASEEARLEHYLSVVGYNRLRNSFYHFYTPETKAAFSRGDYSYSSAKFVPDVTFDRILSLYVNDRRLRLFLYGPLEKIEIAMRAQLIERLGLHPKDGKFQLLPDDLFGDYLKNNKMDGLIRVMLHEAIRTFSINDPKAKQLKSDFNTFQKPEIAHANKNSQENAKIKRKVRNVRKTVNFLNSVDGFRVIHALSFGPLTQIIDRLPREQHIVPISKNFYIHSSTLGSILSSLNHLRNRCAHHETVWFLRMRPFSFPKRFLVPTQLIRDDGTLEIQRLYAGCALLHILMARISEETTWYERLKSVVDQFEPEQQKIMGFRDGWQDLPFWNVSDPLKLISDKKEARI